MHRRQWVFVCFAFLFAVSSTSSSLEPLLHPTHILLQVQRGGWLTGFWLKPMSLYISCRLKSSKALKHTHWSFWFWTFFFFFWSLWRGTAIQCQSYPESVCTKSSSAQRQRQRVKAVLRPLALSKKKGDSRAELALGPHPFRWGATRLFLTSPHGQPLSSTPGWFQQPALKPPPPSATAVPQPSREDRDNLQQQQCPHVLWGDISTQQDTDFSGRPTPTWEEMADAGAARTRLLPNSPFKLLRYKAWWSRTVGRSKGWTWIL